MRFKRWLMKLIVSFTKRMEGDKMPVIADSSAVLEVAKMLPQHQAAITLLNSIVQNPKLSKINWLDLACGKGQIISQLDENLTTGNRKKISYYGYDINVDYSKFVMKIASKLEFDSYNVEIGDLTMFDRALPDDILFDFITCTNVIHELHPQKFLNMLIHAIKRLNINGQLFIYDMESLTNPELGALPLKGAEIKQLIDTVLKAAGSTFEVSPSTWMHRTCSGWSLVINRNYLGVETNAFEEDPNILLLLKREIEKLLKNKLEECTRVLNIFTDYGTETSDEEQQKQISLYEFWAIHKALEELK